MIKSGLTLEPAALNTRQQRFTAKLASACEGSTLKKLYNYPTSGAQICRVIKSEQERGRLTEVMCWPDPEEEPAVKTILLGDDIAAKTEATRWAREKEAKVGRGGWMWWTDGSRTDDGRVGAAAVCKHRDG